MKLQFRGTPNASAPLALSPEREPWGPATVGTSVRVQRAGWGGRQVVKRGRGVLPQRFSTYPRLRNLKLCNEANSSIHFTGASAEPLVPVQVAEWAEKRVWGQFLCLEANFPRSLDSERGSDGARRGEEPQAQERRSWHEA